MPKAFTRCTKKAGSRTRTIKPKGQKSRTYVKVCYPPGGGPPVRGEVKQRKAKK